MISKDRSVIIDGNGYVNIIANNVNITNNAIKIPIIISTVLALTPSDCQSCDSLVFIPVNISW